MTDNEFISEIFAAHRRLYEYHADYERDECPDDLNRLDRITDILCQAHYRPTVIQTRARIWEAVR